MKKILVFCFFLCCLFSSYAQNNTETRENSKNKNFNEIKINGIYLLIGAFETTYERTLNNESGIGLTLFVPYGENIKDDINYYLSSYYRLYFGKEYASGFFVEGFGQFNSLINTELEFIDGPTNVPFRTREIIVNDFGFGVGLGGKWVASSGLVFEINGGLGRNLFNTEKSDIDFFGKISLTIGYRF